MTAARVPGKRRVARRLALEEDTLEQAAIAHDAPDVVLDHRVLQPGEDVVALETVGQRLGGHVGDEHGAGLAQVGRFGGARRQCAEAGDVVEAVRQRLLLEERSRAGAADTVHVGLEHAPVAHVDELGVLAADLHDRQAASALGVEAHGRGGVSDDLVQDGQPRAEVGIGGAHHGSDGVAPRTREADRRHAIVGPRTRKLGDQALGGLDRIAVGAPVEVGQDGARARLDEHTLGARGAEVEAQYDGRRRGRGRLAVGRGELHDRPGTVDRRHESAHAPASLDDELFGVVGP